MAHAEDCKSLYTGSIPVPASIKKYLTERKDGAIYGLNLFWRSSAVELSAVNRSVVGSNPTARAIKKQRFLLEPCFFYVFGSG